MYAKIKKSKKKNHVCNTKILVFGPQLSKEHQNTKLNIMKQTCLCFIFCHEDKFLVTVT